MPPRIKIQKEEIIETAYDIAKEEGLSKINAREIAKRLNCSIQPIFHNFTNMEELKEKVIEKIVETYSRYLQEGAKQEKAYKGMGLAYIQFAQDYPRLFYELFMLQSNKNIVAYMSEDRNFEKIIEAGRKMTGLSKEEQAKFQQKVWIFTHGLATMAASQTYQLNTLEIEELLSSTVGELLAGYQTKKENLKR